MRSKTCRRAFTLIEAVITTTVLGVLGAVTLPLISASTDLYAASSSVVRVVDDLSFALDRIVNILREAPPGIAEGTIDVDTISDSSIAFADGTGCRLEGSTLVLLYADGSEGVVANGVDSFVIRPLAADGSSSMGAASTTQRFEIALSVGGLELRSIAFCRARYGS